MLKKEKLDEVNQFLN